MTIPDAPRNFHLFKTRAEADKKYDELKHAYLIYSSDSQEKGYWVDSILTRKYNPLIHLIIKSK